MPTIAVATKASNKVTPFSYCLFKKFAAKVANYSASITNFNDFKQ